MLTSYRIDLSEFQSGMVSLGASLSEEEAAAEFSKVDKNGQGQVLFDEFCFYVAGIVMPGVKFTDNSAKSTPSGPPVEGASSSIGTRQ